MTNPYAPPKDLSSNLLVPGFEENDSTLYREGNLVVCANHSHWPNRCVVCNTPTKNKQLTKHVFWHPPWIYLLFLLNWIVYLIVAIIVRKKGTVHISLCSTHKKRRVIGLLMVWLGFPLSLGLLFFGAVTAGKNPTLYAVFLAMGILGLIAFPVAGLLMTKTVMPKRIVKDTLWLKASKAFTDSI